MKKIIISIIALTLFGNLFSADFQVGGISYRIKSSEEMTCVVCNPRTQIPFAGAYSESHIVIPQNVEYKGRSFSVVGIDDYAFYVCKNLISVTIPPTIEYIGDYAFTSCENLSIIKGELNAPIGEYAFGGCKALKSVSIQSSSIAIGAFETCSALSTISIAGNVESIGSRAFANCGNIEQVILQDDGSPLTLFREVFAGSPINDLYIGRDLVFYPIQFDGISHLVFGDNVESITAVWVNYISMDEAMRSLFDSKQLKSITLGKKLKKIPQFQKARLDRIICRSELPPEVDGTFSNYNILNAQVFVPKGCSESYKAALPWKNFSITE